jgi:CRISPR-associated protein (TIGR02710 family)
MTMPQTLLLCTVGGAHQPIVSAIQELKPDFVCFICTGKDPGTGKPGSDGQILGTGSVIKARFNDDKPTLPNIPAQTGLAEAAYEVRLTPADDLDAVYRDCRSALLELQQRHPTARLIADYTGGTKTMSAGLVAAALEIEGVELQVVTGNRVDLVKVRDGMQSVAEANADALRLQQALSPFLAGWKHYAYAEAKEGIAGLPKPKGPLLAEYHRARDLSAAFAAWDRFDHATARDTLQGYAATLPEDWHGYWGALALLTHGQAAKREAAQLLDLCLNARRRAAQGRYDDAVARVYRVIEWTAQWLLKTRCGVDTGNLPEGFAPPAMELAPNRDGQRQAGLYQAWQLVQARTEGTAAAFFGEENKRLLGHLITRNNSILAHGTTPIAQAEWRKLQDWLDQAFLPMLLEEVRGQGINALPPQLPQAYAARP